MVVGIVVNMVVGIVVNMVVGIVVNMVVSMVVTIVVGINLVLHPFSYGSQSSNKSHIFFSSSDSVSYIVLFIELHELASIHFSPFEKHL